MGASGLSKSYDTTTGVLTLTGSASLATYQQVLRTATYNDTAAAPNAGGRVITLTVNDGTNASLAHTTTVHVPAGQTITFNTPPPVTFGPGLSLFTTS